MKKLKLFLFGAVALAATSCIVEDEDPAQGLYDSPAVANFIEPNKNLILTTSDVSPVSFSETIFLYTDIPVGEGDASFDYVVNTEETTLSPSDYEITSTDLITIRQGEEVADQTFDYNIIPDNIPVGETSYLVIDLIKVNGGNFIGGKLTITINKCDPPLAGSYTTANSVNFSGDGEQVTISARDCDGNYRGSNIPAFNGTFYFDFYYDSVNNIITVEPSGSNVIPLLPDGSSINGTGTVLTNGTISFTIFDISSIGLTDYSFDLIPN